MIYSEEIARKCASLGAEALDVIDPNWAYHIVPDDLNMSSGCNCIVGQLYSYDVSGLRTDIMYSEILADLFIQPKWSDKIAQLIEENAELYQMMEDDEKQFPDSFLGFDVPFDESEHGADDDIPNQARRYERLRGAWIREIKSRLD